MKKLILISLLFVSQNLFADSPRLTQSQSGEGKAYVNSSGAEFSLVRIDGEAAQVLYRSLEVEPEGHFGLVQTQTKTLENVECVQAILGDMPRPTSEIRYSCTINVRKK